MGYLPGFATPRIVCDVPYVGKRWVHQLESYDQERGISYWTKNYRTGIELQDPEALERRYEYYDPIDTLPAEGQAWWAAHAADEHPDAHSAAVAAAAASRAAAEAQHEELVGG
jgi:lysine 2,3-aminomutase